ncbi:MAG: NtaA/DmoA family FMN-dependent monooxygenase [Rhodospirillales bacterium]
MYHLGWFLGNGFGIQAWNPDVDGPWTGNNETEWMKAGLYVDLTTSLERAGFDYLLIEDTLQVDDGFRGSAETTLRLGLWAPKGDPLPLVPILADRTRHIGIVPTLSSTFYPPYLAARLLTTLDHLTEGRIGFNLVTSGADLSAMNFGMDRLPPKELRYARATEWVEIVKGLQESWEEGAVLADVDGRIYADHRKVHRLDYKGEYLSCRGPLNTIPGPQRFIPMVEAGNSPAGRNLSARFAESMIASVNDVAAMKAFRADMHRRLAEHGRRPEDLKIMFLCSPVIAATDEEAQRQVEAAAAARWRPDAIEYMLWYVEHITGVDLSTLDLNTPVPEVIAELERSGRIQTAIHNIFGGQEKKTLREVMATRSYSRNLGLIGSPSTVAAKMDELMQEVGGDGFLIHLPTTRHAIAQMCDGVAPVLRRRGSIRSGFEHRPFRENRRAF